MTEAPSKAFIFHFFYPEQQQQQKFNKNKIKKKNNKKNNMGEGKGGGRGGVGLLKVVVVCSSQYRLLKGPMFCKMLWLIL